MIKRTNSFSVKSDHHNQSSQSDKGIQGNHQMEDNQNNRDSLGLSKLFKSSSSHKIPEAVIQSIKSIATGKKIIENKKSKTGMALSKKLKTIREHTFICQICDCEYQSKDKAKIAECGHYFCQSCLQHYAIYKVERFQEVTCPNEQCDKVLDQNQKFYKNLPQNIKQKYQKLHAFYLTLKNPHLRLCPSQKCENGILNLQKAEQNQPILCNKCKQKFCPKCLFKFHTGECEKYEVEFFENNLHYRQCQNCKNVVERSEGCNHMTCKCGYEFCYLCGVKWPGYSHVCGNAEVQGQGFEENQNCCECMNNDNVCCMFLKLVIKVTFGFPIWLIMVILTFLQLIIFSAFFFIGVIVIGIFGVTFELICGQQNCGVMLVMILFLPVFMIAGIFIALKDMFCEGIEQELQIDLEKLQEYTNTLLCW